MSETGKEKQKSSDSGKPGEKPATGGKEAAAASGAVAGAGGGGAGGGGGGDGRKRKPNGQIDRAAEAGLPPDHGPEVVVMTIRPAMFRAHPVEIGLLWVAIVGCVVSGLIGLFRAWPTWVVITLGVVVFVAAAWMGVYWLQTRFVALRVTNKRTVEVRGLLSRSTSEVLHDNIRNVQVNQTFRQRVFGVGRIGLSSSGQDGVEIEVENLPNPLRLREVIDLYRDMA